MSRIGKNPVTIPSGVEVKIDGGNIHAKGPKGELNQAFDTNAVSIKVEEGEVVVSRKF